ncbi:helix-turn-helix domain-containing protein [Rhizobium sophoriradicis]|uniref:helix-turn-helix domain-containing protein n=1 Tax=Rhizobium sophoriradicis TaxID=1535245 RepID=UPI003CC93A4C
MLHKPQTKTPNAIDIHVGSRIRLQRTLIGLSQTTLAEGLGITFQQVQKYEKGTNRVGSSRLQAIANILGVPVSWFFEEGPGGSSSPLEPELGAGREIAQFLNSVEGLALNRAFVKIQDDKIRRKLVNLVKTLAKESSE